MAARLYLPASRFAAGSRFGYGRISLTLPADAVRAVATYPKSAVSSTFGASLLSGWVWKVRAVLRFTALIIQLGQFVAQADRMTISNGEMKSRQL